MCCLWLFLLLNSLISLFDTNLTNMPCQKEGSRVEFLPHVNSFLFFIFHLKHWKVSHLDFDCNHRDCCPRILISPVHVCAFGPQDFYFFKTTNHAWRFWAPLTQRKFGLSSWKLGSKQETKEKKKKGGLDHVPKYNLFIHSVLTHLKLCCSWQAGGVAFMK